MKKLKILSLLILPLMLLTKTGICQENDYRFHKVFFYSFTKYVEWPDNYTGGEFVIAVLGKSDITPLLLEMAEIKKAGSSAIKIVTIDENGFNQKINILFVPRDKSGHLNAIVNKLANKPTLLITEGQGLAQKGSMINFKDVDGKLKFEVNTTNLERTGLKVSKELLRFGEEIK